MPSAHSRSGAQALPLKDELDELAMDELANRPTRRLPRPLANAVRTHCVPVRTNAKFGENN
jgi:hypothetical protein